MAVAHAIGRADRHGGLVDDDAVLVDVPADRARDREHMLQIGAAVLVRRRADGDEDDCAVRDRGGGIGREVQAAGRVVGRDESARPGS